MCVSVTPGASAHAQVLCCEVDPIFGTMLGDPANMASFFSLLGRLKPLDCMLAGYFSRVLTGLLLRRAREVLRYLQARSSLADITCGVSLVAGVTAGSQSESTVPTVSRPARDSSWIKAAICSASMCSQLSAESPACLRTAWERPGCCPMRVHPQSSGGSRTAPRQTSHRCHAGA